MHRNDQRFVSIPLETQLTERFWPNHLFQSDFWKKGKLQEQNSALSQLSYELFNLILERLIPYPALFDQHNAETQAGQRVYGMIGMPMIFVLGIYVEKSASLSKMTIQLTLFS